MHENNSEASRPWRLFEPAAPVLLCDRKTNPFRASRRRVHERMFAIWAANGRRCGARPDCTRLFNLTPSELFSSSKPMAMRCFVPTSFAGQNKPATMLALRVSIRWNFRWKKRMIKTEAIGDYGSIRHFSGNNQQTQIDTHGLGAHPPAGE